jgi:APA family basic amino acid/polyamine antiporter
MIYHVDTVSPRDSLIRHLGLFDAVVIGLASMIGAGVFAALGPAARAAGPGLLIGLGIAAVIALCNAMSSARLAALYPESGGTYIYGRRRLGEFWGYLAGWAFIVGKTASCAAMALTVASYLAPHEVRAVALATVIALTATNALGIQKSAWVTRLIVCVVLLCLGLVVVACLAGGQATLSHLCPFPGGGVHGILQSAGLLFFAFAGYARIATLGEEVRDPRRTIGRAIPIALGITLVVYGVVAISALLAVGASGIGGSAAPLRAAVEAGNLHSLGPAVQVGGALAAIGSLIALILGVSRTALAMARDGYLPSALAVHPRGVPVRAELAVGVVVAVLVASVDLRGAVGFSSFGVLVYYGIANASAWTLTREEQALPRWLPLLGILGCVVLAVSLPLTSALAGAGVLAAGVLWWFVRSGIAARRSRTPRRSPAE